MEENKEVNKEENKKVKKNKRFILFLLYFTFIFAIIINNKDGIYMNKRGFAVSSIIYSILILFIILHIL